MKITIGFFNNNGSFIGKKLPDGAKDYFYVHGTVRKKICEHPDTNPYKTHDVRDYTKSYCDKNRMWIHVTEFRSGVKHKEVTNYHYWYHEKDSPEYVFGMKLKVMMQYCIDFLLLDHLKKSKIMDRRKIYLPGHFDVNFDKIEGEMI
jgi:hypothetical protein